MHYTESDLDEREIVNLDDLAAFLDKPAVTWIDVQGLGDEAVLRRLADSFSLHPLALEDVVDVPQRPKAESYDAHLLIITRMVHLQSATAFDIEQVSIFVGKNYVLTFQERYGDVLNPVRARIRRGGGVIRKLKADYLAYVVLDTVIDAYYPIMERIGDFLETLEDEVVQNPTTDSLQKIYHVKRVLLTLRRSIWPQREAINALVRDDSEFVTDPVRVYLRDTYDHCVQLIDGPETYRELVGGLMDVYLSSVGNRQNEVMKVLTIMASIFIPLTFLAGIYGINFENMPELHSLWGYPVLLAIMATVAVGMVLYFRKIGWIGRWSKRGQAANPRLDHAPSG
jgi:magnesium transporter